MTPGAPSTEVSGCRVTPAARTNKCGSKGRRTSTRFSLISRTLLTANSPEKIYRHPKSAFVARFTGISGEFAVSNVREISEKRVEVRLPFDPHMFARAAGVTLHPETSVDGAPGVIRDVAYNGRGYEHVVEVGDKETLTKVYAADRFQR